MPIWQLRDRLFTSTVGSPFRKEIAGHTYLAMSDDATAPLCLANSAVAALIPAVTTILVRRFQRIR